MLPNYDNSTTIRPLKRAIPSRSTRLHCERRQAQCLSRRSSRPECRDPRSSFAAYCGCRGRESSPLVVKYDYTGGGSRGCNRVGCTRLPAFATREEETMRLFLAASIAMLSLLTWAAPARAQDSVDISRPAPRLVYHLGRAMRAACRGRLLQHPPPLSRARLPDPVRRGANAVSRLLPDLQFPGV
jgi:hypothetical protein